MDTFGERLSKLRLKRGLSQSELSERLNIAKSTLAMYETDKREPSFETITKISAFFDVSIDYLVNGHGQGTTKLMDEEQEFVDFIKEVDEAFFYDFHKSPEEQKRQWLETMRALWEVEKRRGNIKPKE